MECSKLPIMKAKNAMTVMTTVMNVVLKKLAVTLVLLMQSNVPKEFLYTKN
jgi:hypothetical protein